MFVYSCSHAGTPRSQIQSACAALRQNTVTRSLETLLFLLISIEVTLLHLVPSTTESVTLLHTLPK